MAEQVYSFNSLSLLIRFSRNPMYYFIIDIAEYVSIYRAYG